LAACWSEPIRSRAGDVLGTFALYYDEPRVPTPTDLHIIEAAALRAAVMLERSREGAGRAALVDDLD
ncbi:MAG: hybrid sensor histidine kinase/response regulator, partial [Longimicrobiales bacterium]